MARHTLYAYAEGNNLHDVAAEIERRVEQYIRDSSWRYGKPWVVNQRRKHDPSLRPGDSPGWDLGLNLDLPDPPNEPEGWFNDVERIAMFFTELRSITGRNFIIGIGDNERGFSEDLFTIHTTTPDLARLRQIIGVGDS